MARPRLVLLITWYLVKNSAINPFLRKRSGQILLGVMVFFSLLNLATYYWGGGGGSGSASLVSPLLSRLGLGHEGLALIVSAAISIYTAYVVARSGPLTIPEEEYEILLSQPISVEEYMLANILSVTLSPLMLTPAFLVLMLVGMAVTGDPVRGILFMFGSLIMLAGVIVAETLLRLLARKTRHGIAVAAAVLLPVAAGAILSILAHRISLLLGIPFLPLSVSLIYPLSRGVDVSSAAALLVAGYAEIVGFSALAALCSRRAGIEDLSPRRPLAARIRERRIRFRTGPPRTIIYSYLFESRILSARHALFLGAALALASVIGYSLRMLGGCPSCHAVMLEFFVPMMTGIMLYSFSTHILANDLKCYWLYRVYGMDMAPVAGALIARLATYTFEAALAMYVGISMYASSPSALLLALLFIPAGIGGAALELIIVSYLASKREVIRETPAGLYSVEGLTAVLLEIVIIALFMGFSALGFYLLSLPGQALLAGITGSIVSSYPLFRLCERIVGDMMTYYDVLI